MNIRTHDVQGFDPAIRGMRNPMNSWDKSDSKYCRGMCEICDDCDLNLDDHEPCRNAEQYIEKKYIVGKADKALSMRLQKAGPEHCKHLRMIFVWADITAPRYWWNEFDTYRNGVEKVSCSTMHKLMARPLQKDDFENDSINDRYLEDTIKAINESMLAYELCKNEDHKKEIWRGIIQALPQSYLQTRTVCMSYAALRNIVRQRQGHKLKEWHMFIDWAKELPNNWMIFE